MKTPLARLSAVLATASFVLSACGAAAPAATAVPAAPAPTATSSKPALGTAANPLVMSLAPSATAQDLIASGDLIAKLITDKTGYVIKTNVPTSYAALVEAMGSGNAHIGWLPPLAYILAQKKNAADVGMATIRTGSDHYGVQFLANASSGFKSYFDEKTNKSTTEKAEEALKQFEGKKPCWTDKLSASGYVVPSGILSRAKITTPEPIFANNHPTVARNLYNKAGCDFGATYNDVRTQDKSLAELTDITTKVVVIWRTPEFIPNDNVSYAKVVAKDMREKLTKAFLDIAQTPEGKAALTKVYTIDGLKAVDDTFYDEFRATLEATGLDVTTLVK